MLQYFAQQNCKVQCSGYLISNKRFVTKNWQLFISNVIFSVLILKCGQLMLEPVRWDRDKCEMQRCRLSKDWTKINIYPPHLPIYIMVLMAASYEAMWVWEGLD